MRIVLRVGASLAVAGMFMLTSVATAATGTATITCEEGPVVSGKKELTCRFDPIKLVVPSTLSLPAAGSGNTFDLTTSSSGFSCAPTASSVPSGSVQISNLAANCTGATAPGDVTWAAVSATAASAVSLQIADTKALTTTASLNFPATTTSLALTLTACTSAGVGCQSYSTSIANSTALVTPTACALTGIPSSQVSEAAALNLGVTGCQGLQSGASYEWRYNGATVGQSASLNHTPFPTGSTLTTGSYVLRVCNPGATTTAGCMSVPNTNGATVTKATTSGGELALCPAGTTIVGTADLSASNTNSITSVTIYTDNGNVPQVLRVRVPSPTPPGDVSARVVWNSSIGASTAKTVTISRDQACGTVGAATLGSTIDAGGRSVRYSTGATTLPYFDAGSTWYIMLTSPGCTSYCNANLEVYR
jgi:hypothetical protein